ncbi:hypothetical protein TERTU_2177 [Teredinibacter turnerae T7901]|uniref:Uncharacterized protein n=1 Tax=Teredinibacter turnerae (strain ATCC 39867 / T7901) TaxID=377629 RepID=C5BJG3_TERTT|nr:hypothetical protein TERTU_2177 [Teredinibacter turnerae T7901]
MVHGLKNTLGAQMHNKAIKQTYIPVLDFALAATLAQNNHLHYGCL